MLALPELLQGLGPLVAGLIEGSLVLHIEITGIAGGVDEGFYGLVEGFVGSGVFLAERGGASAVEMDGGHGEAVDSTEAHDEKELGSSNFKKTLICLPFMVKDAIAGVVS